MNERLDEFAKRAGILVLASHTVGLVRSLCTKAILMEHGRMLWSGDIEEALQRYQERQEAERAAPLAPTLLPSEI